MNEIEKVEEIETVEVIEVDETEAKETEEINNIEDTKLDEKFDLASRWKRLFASIVDSMILMAVLLPILYLTGVFENINNSSQPLYIRNIIFDLIGFVGFYLINIKFLLSQGQTLGKKIFGIKIVDDEGNLPTKDILLKRYSVYFLPKYIPVIGTYIPLINISYIFFNKERRCIHDIVAKTLVVNAKSE